MFYFFIDLNDLFLQNRTKEIRKEIERGIPNGYKLIQMQENVLLFVPEEIPTRFPLIRTLHDIYHGIFSRRTDRKLKTSIYIIYLKVYGRSR